MDDSQELERMINESMNEQVASKKAIDTLHPQDSEQKDRLTILNDEEISSHIVVEWITKALKENDHSKTFLIEGLSDKTKALKVSRGGTGRHEVSSIFKPEIMGELLSSGWIPPSMSAGHGGQMSRKGFFSRFFGR